MRKFSIYIFLLFLTLSASSQDTLKLFDCYRMAEENYPLINQKELIDKIDEYKQIQLKRNYLPSINLNLQASYQSDVTKIPFDLSGMGLSIDEMSKDQYKANLDIHQLIWDGGITKEQQQIDKVDTKLNQQNLKVELYKIKDQVNRFFFNALLLEKQIAVLELSKENIQNNIQKLQSIVEQGMALKSEVQTLEAEKISIEQNITELKFSRLAMLRMLSFLTGREIGAEQQFDYDANSLSLESINQINRPEITSFELERDKQKAFMAKIDASKLPQIVGFGQIGYGRPALNMLSNDFEEYYIIGLNLKWNIWDWNKRNTDKEMLSIQSKMIENQQKTFEHNIWVKHQQNITEVTKLESFISQDKEIIKLRSDIRANAEDKLNNGSLTSGDYLTELNKETQSKLNFEYHKIQLALAKINIKYSLGQL